MLMDLGHRKAVLGVSEQRRRIGAVPAHTIGSPRRFREDRRSHGLGPQWQNIFLQRYHVLEVNCPRDVLSHLLSTI